MTLLLLWMSTDLDVNGLLAISMLTMMFVVPIL